MSQVFFFFFFFEGFPKLYLCTCLVVGFSRMLKDYMSRGLAEAPRYCSDTRGDKGEGIKRRI